MRHTSASRLRSRRIVRHLLFVFVLSATGFACETPCTKLDDSTAESAAPEWPLGSDLRNHLPHQAGAVAFVRRLDNLRSAWDFAAREFSDNMPVPAAVFGGFAPPSPLFEAFADGRLGLDAEAEAALFLRDGHLGLITRLEEPKTLDDSVQSIAETNALPLERSDSGAVVQVAGDGDTALQYRHRNGWLFVRTADRTVPRTGAENEGLEERFSTFFAETDQPWPKHKSRADLLEEVASERAHVAALLAPGPWLAELGTDDHARAIMTRLAHQVGPTAVAVESDSSEQTVEFEVRSRADPDEPVVVEKIGNAEGELPPLGGLVEPGVLGVLHLSVDPNAVYRVLRSTLPAPRREELDAFWRQTRQKLNIHGPEAILENLTGHAVVVFYGLELGEGRLEGSTGEILRDVFELQATREVVLLPIRSRKRLERLLDKLTQVTRGRLSRQKSGHSVEYAWFDDGTLEWALILQDEHLLFVDSATSNAKASQYERQGRPLSASELKEMRLSELFSDPKRSGLFLDTGALANLLHENGFERQAKWLGPFESLEITTGMEGETSHSRLVLKLRER